MTLRRDDVAALCGIGGPTAFVAAWAVGGLLADGYDPLVQTISELAGEGAPTQPLMTAGFVAFGVLLPLWAPVLARRLEAPALRPVVTTAGLATLAVAAAPITRDGGSTQDLLHTIAAATGYLAMAATPLVAAPALRRLGRGRLAAASVGVGLVSAASLVGTLLVGDSGPVGSGGLQRLGLTVVDAWHVVAAGAVLASRRTSPR